MKKGTWPKTEPVEQIKRFVEPLISFARHPFGPADPADDRDYLDLRDRVLRSHGIWAPPGSSYRIGEFSELERPSNPPARGVNLE
jgi:hypothetical protein